MAKFTYEITPTMHADDGHIEKCEESDADQWSVYERPTESEEPGGPLLAVWVADFARETDARVFAEMLEKNQLNSD